jgi:uncharacterized damage-inducible protein DinB
MTVESTMGNAQSIPTPDALADELTYAHFLFWETLAEMEREEIESAKLRSGWSAKALVAHFAFWDDYQQRRMQAALDGTSHSAGFMPPSVDNDERARGDASRVWDEVEAAAKSAQQRLVAFVRNLPPEALQREYQEGGHTFSILEQVQHMADHVREHRRQIQEYCGSLERWGRAGLRKLMVEQHNNLMDSLSGLSEETMLAEQVCGVWSIRDVFAHVLSWNEYCSLLLRHWPQPKPELIREWQWRDDDTMATVNARLLEARSHLTMIEIADGLTTEFRRMMRAFDRASDADLLSEGLTWDGPGVMSNFFYEIFVHEAEHAAQIWAFRAGVVKEEAALNRSDDS